MDLNDDEDSLEMELIYEIGVEKLKVTIKEEYIITPTFSFSY
jgi:hypothetical protein